MGLSNSGGNAASNIKINSRSSTANTLNSSTSGTYDINTLIWNIGSTPGGDQTLNISSGQILRLGANDAITNVHSDNRTFNVGNSVASSAITAGGAANTAAELSLYSVSLGNGSARLQIKSPITDNGTGKVTVNTLGDVQLNLADTYSGGTYINIGRVWANTVTGFGTGPVYIHPGGEHLLNNSSSGAFANNFFIAGYGSAGIVDPLVIRQANASATLSGTITLLGTAVIAPNGNSLTTSGSITGPGGMYVMGAYNNGSLHLDESSANTYNGDTTIDAAGFGNDTGHAMTIWVDNSTHNNIMPAGSGMGNLILIGGGSALAQFDIGGSTQTINGLSSSGTAAQTFVTSNPGGGTLNIGANDNTSEFDGVIGTSGGNGTANINIAKIGAGTLTLGGANNYTGNTTIGNGVLALGSSGSIASSAQISVSNSAAFNVSQVACGWSMGANQILFVTNATLSAASINGGAASTTIALANATVNLTGTAGSLAAPISTFSTSNSVLNLAAISFATTNISVSTLNTGGAATRLTSPISPARSRLIPSRCR